MKHYNNTNNNNNNCNEKERERGIQFKRKKPQVMHDSTAHRLLTDAQPVPELRSPDPSQHTHTHTHTRFYTEHDVLWHGIPLWLVWVSCTGCVPSQFLVPL